MKPEGWGELTFYLKFDNDAYLKKALDNIIEGGAILEGPTVHDETDILLMKGTLS